MSVTYILVLKPTNKFILPSYATHETERARKYVATANNVPL